MSDRAIAAAAGTVRLGDLEVARMGFGAMRLTGEGIWGPPDDREEAHRVLRTAVHELGITFVDTADAYGPDVDEELIAEALHPYPEELVVGTKGGSIRPDGEWKRNGRPEHLRRALHGSLRRLRLDRIDLYQLHAPDPDVPIEDSLGELSRLRDEGKIRHIGVSNFDVEQLGRALTVTPVVSVQNHYNLDVHGESDPVVEWCEERGIAFMAYRPLAGGKLESDAARRLAERREISPSQVALAWLLHRSPVMLPIPGTSSIEHLRENTAAAELELGSDDLEGLAES